MLCTRTAFQTVKNQQKYTGVRGANSWWRLTREVAGKTGVRLERLADKVHNPRVFAYKDGLAALQKWEHDLRELAKIEQQELSDLTKRTTLKKMLPEDLQHDFEKDKSLKTWEEAWQYVLEQVPLRKDWKVVAKRGKNDMDVDITENYSPERVAKMAKKC